MITHRTHTPFITRVMTASLDRRAGFRPPI